MASTAEELASQAEQLQGTISFFRVDERALSRTAAVREALGEHHTEAKAIHKPKVTHITHAQKTAPAKGKGKVTKAAVGGEGYDLEMDEGHDHLDSDFEKF